MARPRCVDRLEGGQTERERLARACLGLAADVSPGQRIFDRRGLDGKRFVDALRREGVDDLGPEAELSECGHVAPQPVRRVGGRSSASPNGKQVRDGRGPRQMVVGTRTPRIAGQGNCSAHRPLSAAIRAHFGSVWMGARAGVTGPELASRACPTRRDRCTTPTRTSWSPPTGCTRTSMRARGSGSRTCGTTPMRTRRRSTRSNTPLPCTAIRRTAPRTRPRSRCARTSSRRARS